MQPTTPVAWDDVPFGQAKFTEDRTFVVPQGVTKLDVICIGEYWINGEYLWELMITKKLYALVILPTENKALHVYIFNLQMNVIY